MAEANDDWRHDAAHETAHAAHEREHELVTTSHRNAHTFAFENHEKEHGKLAEDLKETARELSMNVRETAERLASTLRTTADTHWRNHEIKHVDDNRAMDKAENALNARLVLMNETIDKNKKEGNEWRAALSEREVRFASREQMDALEKALLALNQWRDRTEGKQQGIAPVSTIIFSVITAVAVLIATRFIFPGGN